MDTEVIETPTESVEAAPSFDVKAAAEQIGHDLFPETPTEEPETPAETVTEALVTKDTVPAKAEVPEPPPVPKSFRADLKDVWTKIPPEAQQYYLKREKDMLDGLDQYKGAAQYGNEIQKVLAPYQPMLQSKGLEAPAVINDLLVTYSRLTQGSMEQRQAALTQVCKNLGVTLPTPGAEPVPVDPRLQSIEQKLHAMEEAQTAQQRVALQAAREKAAADVNAFANDPKHDLFDACHEDIVKFITAGDSLQDAYDKAVWANPVTREKQKLSYFQTESEKAKERARLDALPKQKARSVNVNGKDTQRTPTDTLGSMEDTMRKTLRSIKERAAH